MIYPRKLKSKMLKQLDNELVVVVTGMRRVGKTFLLQDIYNGIDTENKLFLDLEKLESKKIFEEESSDAIWRNFSNLGLKIINKEPGKKIDKKKRAFIFLDEIQLVRTLPSIIKYFVDHYQVKFIVSGSSSFYLKNLFTESLAGRKIIYHLRPLDFGEYLIFKKVKPPKFVERIEELLDLNTKMIISYYQSLFEEYLEVGGFPQAVLAVSYQERESILKDILNSYLSIDVRTLSDIKGIRELEKLVQILPARVGQKVDFSKLSRIVGISRHTVKDYLDFLEATFVVSLLKPYSKSKDREVSATPKFYFCDIGLAEVLGRPSEGQLFENSIFNSLVDRFPLNYYQRKSGGEIDFIIRKETAVETKVFADIYDYRKLKELARALSFKNYLLFSKYPPKEKNSKIYPALLLGFLQ